MLKTAFKVLAVLLLVGLLFGAIDVAVPSGHHISSGVVGSVFADGGGSGGGTGGTCPDGRPGCITEKK